MGFFDFLNGTLAIEAGSSCLRIIKDGDIVYNEPTAISFNPNDNRVSGVGNSINSTPPNKIIEPFNYVISDFVGFESCLRGAIKKIDNQVSLFPKSYKMFFSIPIGTTEIEKRAFRDSAEHAGAKEVCMIHSPYCTALELNLLKEVRDFLIVDFSKSKFEVTMFCNSIPVSEGTLRLGTQQIENLVKNHIYRSFNILPAEDEVRLLLSSTFSNQNHVMLQHKEVELLKVEELIDHYLTFVIDELFTCIDTVKNSSKNEALGRGIYFTGGGAKYENICQLIAKRLNLVSNLSANPLHDNVNGLSKIMANPKGFEEFLMN
ncbi:rod shape-determining protein [Reichenbachiella sp.]|uniref:rod shape-determining protein n=1 Tax=Reichenbachiella sp. TaxID=2184521 RepID=UPI003BB05026